MEWTLNEHQEKFLDKLLHAQTSSKNTIKSVQQMQLRIKENETDIRKDERQKIADKIRSIKIDELTDAGTIADIILND